MGNTATVYARIDPKLKNDVENILLQLGMTPSSLIQMLYSEIRLTKKVPLSLSLPTQPVFMSELTKEQFDEEVNKGMKNVKEGKMHSIEEMDEILKKDLGI